MVGRTRRGAHPVCVAPAWFTGSCFLDVFYGCACGGAGRRQAGCRQGPAPVWESPSSAGSRAVVGEHRPPSIPPIPRSRTPLGVHRSVWGGAPGVSLRSPPGSFLQPLQGRRVMGVVGGPTERVVEDGHAAGGHGGPRSRGAFLGPKFLWFLDARPAESGWETDPADESGCVPGPPTKKTGRWRKSPAAWEVEAAGIEPASCDTLEEASTCIVA